MLLEGMGQTYLAEADAGGEESRTHRLRWLALIPHSPASRDTDAPGRPHAATSSALAASSYTLRPSLLRPTTSRRANSSIPSDMTFPRSPTWKRNLSDCGASLKDGVDCALTFSVALVQRKANRHATAGRVWAVRVCGARFPYAASRGLL